MWQTGRPLSDLQWPMPLGNYPIPLSVDGIVTDFQPIKYGKSDEMSLPSLHDVGVCVSIMYKYIIINKYNRNYI